MKKRLVLILTALMLLVSCDSAQTNSLPDTSSISSETVYNTSSQPEKTYLELDETKSQEYNEAIKAFNTFLNYNCYERNEEDDIFGRSIGEYPVDIYALFDVTHDEIPELLTEGPILRVFSFQEGKVMLSYVDKDGPAPMTKSQYFLENGASVTVITSNGREYYYRTFSDKSTLSDVYFHDDYFCGKYHFDGEEVSKEEYDNLTKDYFEAMEKKADLTWYNYSSLK